MKTCQQRFDDKWIPEPNSGCWLWLGAGSENKYGDVRPFFHFDGKSRLAYRVSYRWFKGEIPRGMQVCHTCDNGLCVNPDHLFAGTAKDNSDDCLRKNRCRYLYGEDHPQCKLTSDHIAEIRALRCKGLLHREIAIKFGVTRERVGQVLAGQKRGVPLL